MAENDIEFLLSKSPAVAHEPYWTKLEKEILQEEVIARSNVIEGKFKGAQCGKQEKEKAWQEVADAVNAKGTCKKRTTKQVRKQWSNLKQRAKKINSETKYPSTGGGPKPPSPSPLDEAMLSFLSGKPSLEGVDGGMETSVGLHIEEAEPSRPEVSDVPPVKKQKRTCQRDINEIHCDVLLTEKEKLVLEMDYIRLKIKKVESEIELLEMRKNSLKSPPFLSLSQVAEF